MPEQETGSSRLRRGRWSESGRIYHVTTATIHRVPAFSDFRRARILVDCLRCESTSGRAATLAFVIMPDHLHWLLQLGTSDSLQAVVARVKSGSARRINRHDGATTRFGWQPGFHDRALRRDDDLVTVARYIVANPLRAGLVESIGQYPHWDAIWLEPRSAHPRL